MFLWNKFKKKQEDLNLLNERITKATEILNALNTTNVDTGVYKMASSVPEFDWDKLKCISISRSNLNTQLVTYIVYLNEKGSTSYLTYYTTDDAHNKILENFVKWKTNKNVQQ